MFKMVVTHEEKSMGIEEFKEKLIERFSGPYCYDVTLSQLIKIMGLRLDDVDQLQFCLDELTEDGWLEKSSSFDHYEYDPGKRLEFGGLRG